MKEGVALTNKELVERKKRQETLRNIINHRVIGEGYITTSASVWKSIVLKYFNKVYRNEMNVSHIMEILERQGVVFNQQRELIK